MLKQADLKKIAAECAQKIHDCKQNGQYDAEPFQHFQIDNFFPTSLAQACLDNFPALSEPGWHHSTDEGIEVKSRTTWASEFDIPDGIIDVVRILNSAEFLKAIGEALDIPKLMPDPYFAGGGLNCTTSGGLLDIHVDGNYHDASGMHRRVNALLYLNKNWQEGWGGEFGIYDQDGERLVKQIPPLFNRLVVFDTHDKSYHGLPNPITFPEGEDRKSIILYYYTVKERPNHLVSEDKPHSALWKKKGYTDKKGNKTREYT